MHNFIVIKNGKIGYTEYIRKPNGLPTRYPRHEMRDNDQWLLPINSISTNVLYGDKSDSFEKPTGPITFKIDRAGHLMEMGYYPDLGVQALAIPLAYDTTYVRADDYETELVLTAAVYIYDDIEKIFQETWKVFDLIPVPVIVEDLNDMILELWETSQKEHDKKSELEMDFKKRLRNLPEHVYQRVLSEITDAQDKEKPCDS